MDIRRIQKQLPAILQKYKYAAIILVIGIVLMTIPGKGNATKQPQENTAPLVQQKDAAQELAAVLTQIQGVGKVQVLLTVKAGESMVYQTDEDVITSETGSTIRKETVIIADSDRNQEPLLVQVLPPQYLGAVIVCQGADNATVRLAVVEAVCNATGLGADKISVLKMK